ncbi:MAG: hypothetical protein JXA19_00590 [Anaerolineales bacterium]|nr:hypothetical protein [Anaerolineales bacterium]
MIQWLENLFEVSSKLLGAGIAITAFSLFLRSLTFNLKNRVTRTFVLFLFLIFILYTGETLAGISLSEEATTFWMRVQWMGVVFLPATFFHFTDSLLETTGNPSKGKRKLLTRISYLTSGIFALGIPFSFLVSNLHVENGLYYLERTTFSWIFLLYYFGILALAFSVLWRAYKRTVLSASQRRMGYLMISGASLVLGAFPYLLFASNYAIRSLYIFRLVALISNIVVILAVITLGYAVAFFGVSWPDRIVKSRLIKWLLRGPFTTLLVLVEVIGAQRLGNTNRIVGSFIMPLTIVATILIMQHVITIFLAPLMESWFIYTEDDGNIRSLRNLEERLVTMGDLSQFLEMILAGVCDQFQTNTAFAIVMDGRDAAAYVDAGDRQKIPSELNINSLLQVAGENGEKIFSWEGFWLLPLKDSSKENLLGLLGVIMNPAQKELDFDDVLAFQKLGDRTSLIIESRQYQQEVLRAVEELNPRIDYFQRLRAASRYDKAEVYSEDIPLPNMERISDHLKDALKHYWGGPKLQDNPLIDLQIVQSSIEEHDGNSVNALRSVIKEALEVLRPSGERRFTGEWLIYNILDLKFFQGHKVRDVARKLSVSEADLYRKQRIAIETLANTIIDMERLALANVYSEEDAYEQG